MRPSTLATRGCTVRSRKALARRIPSSGWPTMRGSSALIYATISGSSGMAISLHVVAALWQRRFWIPRCNGAGRTRSEGWVHPLNSVWQCSPVMPVTSDRDFRHRQRGQGRRSILLTVTWRFKLVASVLVMILPAMPISALASCWWHMATAEDCTPHCPMMSGHAPSLSVEQAPANSSCCQVSAPGPAPASMPQAPSGSSVSVALTLSALTLDAPIALTQAEPVDPVARASSPSLQSVFCTFLI